MVRHPIIDAWRSRVAGVAAMLFLSCVVAAQAQAQEQSPAPAVESVTVEAAKEARPTPFLTGGSRWMFPICPVTLGLTAEQNQRVNERVRQVAQLVGAPSQASGRCTTNAEIVFTDHPQAFLDAVADKRFRLLGGTPTQAKEAAKVRYPVQSWYSTAMMDADGSLLLMPPDDDDCDPYCFFHLPGVSEGPRIVIGTVIIVVDINQAQNRSLTALSDYIALMALTQARAFAKCQAAPSIANLMAPDCAGEMQSDELTAGDIVWMRGLYHMSPERARRADAEDLAAQAGDKEK
jgi:hypothetical protein